MLALVIAGVIAGTVFGYVLKRADLCFHSMFRGLYEQRFLLFKTWLLGVTLAAVGLAAVFSFGPWEQLLRGLALRPVDNLVGGLVLGVGMVTAASCVSGLYYKLSSGMLGGAVGLVGWAAGELAARAWWTPGATVLGFGPEATLYGVLGVDRWVVVPPLAVVVIAILWRTRREIPDPRWRWGWPVGGVALGVATTVAWVTAGAGGATFGPSTVGAVASIAEGSPNWWLIAFLAALVLGAFIAARTAGGWWLGRSCSGLAGGSPAAAISVTAYPASPSSTCPRSWPSPGWSSASAPRAPSPSAWHGRCPTGVRAQATPTSSPPSEQGTSAGP